MIKKTDKDFYVPFGLSNVDEAFNRPCLLTIWPKTIKVGSKNLNGAVGKICDLLHICSKKSNSEYGFDNIPFDVVAVEDNEKNISEKICEKITKGNVEQAKSVLRDINILSYCAGNKETAKLMIDIHDKLLGLSYTEDEVRDIMSEIFVIELVDNYRVNRIVSEIPYATKAVVQDVFDNMNTEHVIDFNSDNPFISTSHDKDNNSFYLYHSFGENSLYEIDRDHDLTEDYFRAPIVNAVITLNIIKAISASVNKKSKKSITIYKELQDIINKAQVILAGRDLDTITQTEKEELNKKLLEEIPNIFKENIAIDELSDSKKSYIQEKDKLISSIAGELNNFNKIYNSCIIEIDNIINVYSNKQNGEVVEIERNNEGIEFEINKEDYIINHLKTLHSNIVLLFEKMKELKIPVDFSVDLVNEFDNYLASCRLSIKKICTSELFRKIYQEFSIDEEINMTL